FFTATPFCILPMTRFQGEAIGSGQVGPVTKSLLSAWGEDVGVDIVNQIKGWNRNKSLDGESTTYAFGKAR
ncbi:MAG: branched-chain amino acid aminotransferase, partial [Pseudomonadota bacterium]